MLKISIDGLSPFFGEEQHFSADIQCGTYARLLGGSGSGKTSVLLDVGGLSCKPQTHCGTSWRGCQTTDYREQHPQFAPYIPGRPECFFSNVSKTAQSEIGIWVSEPSRIHHSLKTLGLEPLALRDPMTLSGGEKARLAIACAIAQQPEILLLDQCLEWIDVDNTALVVNAIQEIVESGGVVIEATSRKHSNCIAPNVVIEISLCKEYATENNVNHVSDFVTMDRRAVHVDVQGLNAKYDVGEFSLGPISFTASSGDVISLTGANGAGKTTVLKALALSITDWSGHICVTVSNGSSSENYYGDDYKRKAYRWRNVCSYATQEPDEQLFLRTVKEEIESGLSCGGLYKSSWAVHCVEKFCLSGLLEYSPLALPRGMRRVVQLCVAIANESPLVLLDEPTAGLSDGYVRVLEDIVRDMKNAGRVVVMVSHDSRFIKRVSNTSYKLDKGKLIDN